MSNSQHFGGKEACWSFGMGTMMSDKWDNYSHGLAQTKQQGLVHSWSTFGAQVNTDSQDSLQLRLGGSTTFPLIVFSMHGHMILRFFQSNEF
jgi:hypothetical protein